jgi:hypothetical protein
MRLALAATALLVAQALPAVSDIRPADQYRMAQFHDALLHGLRHALAEGAPADVAVLAEAMRGAETATNPAEGEWSCRTLKLGGTLPLTVYQPFRCRITRTGENTWQIEKLSGSQRFLGEILEEDGFGTYTGVAFVGEVPATTYDQLPPDDQPVLEPGQTHAQVGFWEQAGPDQARLFLPLPLFESEIDIIHLTR